MQFALSFTRNVEQSVQNNIAIEMYIFVICNDQIIN